LEVLANISEPDENEQRLAQPLQDLLWQYLVQTTGDKGFFNYL
jgi:hypothetical protein